MENAMYDIIDTFVKLGEPLSLDCNEIRERVSNASDSEFDDALNYLVEQSYIEPDDGRYRLTFTPMEWLPDGV